MASTGIDPDRKGSPTEAEIWPRIARAPVLLPPREDTRTLTPTLSLQPPLTEPSKITWAPQSPLVPSIGTPSTRSMATTPEGSPPRPISPLYTPSPEKNYGRKKRVTFDSSVVENSPATQPRPSISLSPSANIQAVNNVEEAHSISKQPQNQDHRAKMDDSTAPSVQPSAELTVEATLSTSPSPPKVDIMDEIVDIKSLRTICALRPQGLLDRINELVRLVHSQANTIQVLNLQIKDPEGHTIPVPKFPLDENGQISFVDITDAYTMRAAAYLHGDELVEHVQEQAFTIHDLNAECNQDEFLIRRLEDQFQMRLNMHTETTVKLNHATSEYERLKDQLTRRRMTPIPPRPCPRPPVFPPQPSVLKPGGRKNKGIGKDPDFGLDSVSDITETVGDLAIGEDGGSIDSSTDTAGTRTSRLDPAAATFVPSNADSTSPTKSMTQASSSSVQSPQPKGSRSQSTTPKPKKEPLSEEMLAVVSTIPAHWRAICPHSLSSSSLCPNGRCTMQRVCPAINAPTPTSCAQSPCHLTHVKQTCEEELASNGTSTCLSSAKGAQGRKVHIAKKAHRDVCGGKNSEEWKVRVVLAGLREAHKEGGYMG